MSSTALDHVAAEALRRYPAAFAGALQPLGNHGGFSGARLWRVGGCCLRAWPPDDSFPARLTYIHQLMDQARAAGLAFVPRIERTLDQSLHVELGERWWELAEWLPGRADFREQPNTARLEAACIALAQFHCAWEPHTSLGGLCPAIQRRVDARRIWQDLRNTGWSPRAAAAEGDPVYPLIGRALPVLEHWLGLVPGWLLPWTKLRWPLQPCLCDVWHEHLLFEGDRLAGLVDFGSIKLDHVAVDLARLLGSLVEDDEAGWRHGLAAYRAIRPLSACEADLGACWIARGPCWELRTGCAGCMRNVASTRIARRSSYASEVS